MTFLHIHIFLLSLHITERRISSTISTKTGNRGIFLHNGNSTPLIWYHQSRHKLCDEKTSHHLINYLYSFFLKGPSVALFKLKLKGSMRKKKNMNRNEMYFPDFFWWFLNAMEMFLFITGKWNSGFNNLIISQHIIWSQIIFV